MDFYIKQVIFDENIYNQEVSSYDTMEHFGNVTNVYKANYNNEYSEISRTLLVRFEKNQKTSDSFEYYVCFVNDKNIKTDEYRKMAKFAEKFGMPYIIIDTEEKDVSKIVEEIEKKIILKSKGEIEDEER